MGMVVTLRASDGTVIRKLPDPSGGSFDAAGDFDQLLEAPGRWPVLGSSDPYDVTTLRSNDMDRLLKDVEAALAAAKAGPERRGLLRLQVLVTRCREDEELVLHFEGD
jgi:hypothetical protein